MEGAGRYRVGSWLVLIQGARGRVAQLVNVQAHQSAAVAARGEAGERKTASIGRPDRPGMLPARSLDGLGAASVVVGDGETVSGEFPAREN